MPSRAHYAAAVRRSPRGSRPLCSWTEGESQAPRLEVKCSILLTLRNLSSLLDRGEAASNRGARSESWCVAAPTSTLAHQLRSCLFWLGAFLLSSTYSWLWVPGHFLLLLIYLGRAQLALKVPDTYSSSSFFPGLFGPFQATGRHESNSFSGLCRHWAKAWDLSSSEVNTWDSKFCFCFLLHLCFFSPRRQKEKRGF